MSGHFNNVLYYDETSPSCLRWSLELRTGMNHTVLLVEKDQIAGTLSHQGYWVVCYRGVMRSAHRIVIELDIGRDLLIEEHVDHEDRNSENNKKSNLRVVSRSVNARNLSKRVANTSGVTGVNLHRQVGRSDRWCAQARRLDGSRWIKMFSTIKYGYEGAFKLACEARKEMIEELNKQGAGYHPTHGDLAKT